MGSFFRTSGGRNYVVSTVLRDLARLHNVTEAFVREQLVDYHLWDWYDNEFSAGGFATCDPVPVLHGPAGVVEACSFGKGAFCWGGAELGSYLDHRCAQLGVQSRSGDFSCGWEGG